LRATTKKGRQLFGGDKKCTSEKILATPMAAFIRKMVFWSSKAQFVSATLAISAVAQPLV